MSLRGTQHALLRGPSSLRLGTHNPRFVVSPLELGLGTHNPRFVAWPLSLGLGAHNPRSRWPLKRGLGLPTPTLLRGHARKLGLGLTSTLCCVAPRVWGYATIAFGESLTPTRGGLTIQAWIVSPFRGATQQSVVSGPSRSRGHGNKELGLVTHNPTLLVAPQQRD